MLERIATDKNSKVYFGVIYSDIVTTWGKIWRTYANICVNYAIKVL
jgi:hypothetical protein